MAPIEITTTIEFYYTADWHVCYDVMVDPPPTWEYGLPGAGPTDWVADTGVLTFTLDNSIANTAGLEGYYTQGHANAPAWFVDGLPVVVICERQDTHVATTRFTGWMVATRPTSGMYGEQTVEVEVRDWMDYAATQKIGILPIELAITADDALTSALTNFPAAHQPTATDFDVGVETWARCFDTDDSEKQKMMALFQKICRNEGGGQIFVEGDGTLRFDNRSARPLAATSFNLDPVHDLDAAWDRQDIINRVECEVYPYTTDAAATTLLWKLQKTFAMTAAQTLTLRCPFRDPTTGKRISGIDVVNPLVAGTHIKYGSVDDGSTNDLVAGDTYVKALLHMDGADTSTTFTDETGKTWTAQADAQIDTGQSEFGGASGLFDGTGDYLSTPNSADFNFGTGNWTVDFWIRRDGTKAYPGIIGACTSGNNGWSIHLGNSDNKIRVIWNNIQKILTAGVIADLTWTHVAVVRNGNTVTVYLNGTADANTDDCTGDTIDSNGTGATIGRVWTDTNDYYWDGWIDEVRVSKGIARWTANFTPPTAAYPPGLSFPMVVGGNSAEVILTATVAGYVNFIEIKGKGIYTYDPLVQVAEDAASIALYGERPLTIDMEQLSSPTTAQSVAAWILENYLGPSERVERVRFLANFNDEYATAMLTLEPNVKFGIAEQLTATLLDYYATRIRMEAHGPLVRVEIVPCKAPAVVFFIWDLADHGWDEGRWGF